MPLNHEQLTQFLEKTLPGTLETLREMVAINSFTANPDGVNQLGKVTVEAFAGLGFDSEYIAASDPELGNHLVLRKAAVGGPAAPTIALVSHLDTVYPAAEEKENDFFWRPEGERIYGPGTVDIKGGTAMIHLVLSALRELHEERYQATNWLILFNAAEERLVLDFGKMAKRIIPADALACLVFEGGRLRNGRFSIVAARKGMVTYQIRAAGKAAHAGSSHKRGANAITQLARTVDAVAGMTDYDQDMTFNVGVFKGGTVSNRVPHRAEARGEMRAYSRQLLDQSAERLLALSQNGSVVSKHGHFPCTVTVDILGRWGPMSPNEATDGLLANWQQAAREMGADVLRQERGGLSDANFLWDHVPTLDGLGPSGGNAHCSERSADGKKDQEYVELPSFVPKATLNTLAIVRLLEAHS